MIAGIQHAVASAIAAKAACPQPFTQPLTASAAYLPVEDLAAMTGINVYVVPSSARSEIATRDSERGTYEVDVVVSKKLAADDRTSPAWHSEMVVLLGLVEEIAEYLRFMDMAGAEWTLGTVSPLYDPKRLKETNVFLSVIRLTYWVVQ